MSKMLPEIRVPIARNTVHEVWGMLELLAVLQQEFEAEVFQSEEELWFKSIQRQSFPDKVSHHNVKK